MGKKSKRRNGNKKKGAAAAPAAAAPTKAKVVPSDPPVQATAQPPQPQPQSEPEPEEVKATKIPPALESNLHLLTASQQNLACTLCLPPNNQSHIFASWADEAVSDSSKVALISQLERMDQSYPSGGLAGYISNAKKLLLSSCKGENPLQGWKPEVPIGENLQLGTEDFDRFEGIGLKEVGKCGFALVAGGLGERLGYGGIKVSCILDIIFNSSRKTKTHTQKSMHLIFKNPHNQIARSTNRTSNRNMLPAILHRNHP